MPQSGSKWRPKVPTFRDRIIYWRNPLFVWWGVDVKLRMQLLGLLFDCGKGWQRDHVGGSHVPQLGPALIRASQVRLDGWSDPLQGVSEVLKKTARD